MSDQCRHRAYELKNGELLCQECGELSPSQKWQGNVYGQQHQAREATAGTKDPTARRRGRR